MKVKVANLPTVLFGVLFWLLGVAFLMTFSDVSWWIAFIGILIGSIEVKVNYS